MYIVEGTIGAGKSTFLTLLAEKLPHVSVLLEPLHNWQKQVYGQSLLAHFYQDPKRWAYTLETIAMMCRVRDHIHEQKQAKIEGHVRLLERSIYSGHYCFATNSYASGFMTTLEWQLYQQWFNFLIPNICMPPRGFIYLRVDPEIAYQRIKKRNRLSEKNLTLAYLRSIHQQHENFLINKHNILPELEQVPVLIIDCNTDFEHDSAQLLQHTNVLNSFIEQTELLHTHIIASSHQITSA